MEQLSSLSIHHTIDTVHHQSPNDLILTFWFTLGIKRMCLYNIILVPLWQQTTFTCLQ